MKKYAKHYINFILIIISILVISACKNDTNIYANSISFCDVGNSYFVGEELIIDSSKISIYPADCNVDYVLTSSNAEIAQVNGKTISFVSSGEVNISALINSSNNKTIKTDTTINVEVPIYTNELSVQYDSMIVGMNDNKTNISSYSNCSFAPVISYSKGDVVSYDLSTGLITPINIGNDIVTITYMTGLNTFDTTSFSVIVSPYISSVDIGCTSIVLLQNYSVNFSYDILPNNTSFLPEISSDNNNLFRLVGNQLVAINCGECNLVVSYNSGTQIVTQNYPITILPSLDNLVLELLSEDTSINHLFTTKPYTIKVSADGITQSIFETYFSCSFANDIDSTHYVDNAVIFTCHNDSMIAGSTKTFSVGYTIDSNLGGSYVDVVSKTASIYNVVSGYSVTMPLPQNELNEYVLYIKNGSDTDYPDYISSVNFSFLPQNNNTLGISYSFLANDILTISSNTITANKVGTTQVVISSVDGYLTDLTITIVVKNCEVQQINNVQSSYSIYVGSTSSYYKSQVTFSVEIYPLCAIYSSVEYTGFDDFANMNGDTLLASCVGTFTLTIQVANITKTTNISVLSYPNRIEGVLVGDSSVNIPFSSNYTMSVGSTVQMSLFAYNNTSVLNNFVFVMTLNNATNTNIVSLDRTQSNGLPVSIQAWAIGRVDIEISILGDSTNSWTFTIITE